MKTTTKTRIRRVLGLGLLISTAVGFAVAGVFGAKASAGSAPKANAKAAARAMTTTKPSLRFVENKGQWDSTARLLGRGAGMDTWVTDSAVLFDAYKIRQAADNRPSYLKVRTRPQAFRTGHVLKMEFLGGTNDSFAQGWGSLPGRENYLVGSKSITDAPSFEEARVRNIYPGIDARVYFQSNSPRYDLLVAPGADPSVIRLQFSGADRVQSRSATELRLGTKLGDVVINGLYAYQNINNRKVQVGAAFRVSGNQVSFQLGSYDRTKPLIIDPVVFSSFLGGAGSVDIGNNVAVDRFNRAYVCGSADGSTFPTSIGAYDEQMVATDGFVSRFLADGSDVEYSTYVGGSTVDATAPITLTPSDSCNDIAVDFDGNAYVVGATLSNDFDVSAGVAQGTYHVPPAAPDQTAGDYQEGFVMKLSADGTSRVWATFVGGQRLDTADAIALGQDGAIYVVGSTQSEDLPTVSALQAAMKGDGDGFIGKLTSDGTAWTYLSYLGGTDAGGPTNSTLSHGDDDIGLSVAVDSDHNAYALLRTRWNDAPKKIGSFDTSVNNLDNLVLKFSVDGTSLVFGTFLGGNDNDFGFDMALDRTNNVFICGATFSFNYPRTTGVFDRVYNLGLDCFVTKLNRTGTGLIYSTFMGFANGGYPVSIAVDDLGYAHMAGFISQGNTTQVWLPVTANADYPAYNGPGDPFLANGDAFLYVMNDTATAPQYCSYLGGEKHDQAIGIALDGSRNAYLTGLSISSSDLDVPFPTTPDAFQVGFVPDALPDSLPDSFLTKIKTRLPVTITGVSVSPNYIPGGDTSTGTVTISAPASVGGHLVSIENDNNSIVTTPASVTIPEGATSATFTINTTATLVERTVVKITATVEGDSKFTSLTVTPWLEGFTLSNTTVVGGNAVGARVDLSFPARTGGMTVNLHSTVPTAATVPASVTVPEGQRTALFDVSTLGVNSIQTVDLTANLFGITITQQLDVTPASLFAISLDPVRVSGGTPSAGIVQLNGSAPPGGVTITLSSSDPAASVPATVFINEQERSVPFDVTTSVVDVNTSVTITATLGASSVQTNIDVLETNLISLTVAPDSVLGGNISTGTVGLDLPAAPGGVIITLASSNPAVASVPATVTVPAGSTNANFQITTTVQAATQNVTISADRDGAGILPALTANLEVRHLTFTLTVDPDTVPGGSSSTGTVVIDEAAPTSGVTISLTSDNPAASVPATVTVSAGNTQATFPISTVAVTTDTVVTIGGSFLSSSASDTLTVTAAVPISLEIDPDEVLGGDSATGTVTLSGIAPAGGSVVTLSSDNAAAVVPGTVTVPEGQASASFQITTTGVLSDTVATITASVGATSVDAELTVRVARLIELRFLPSRIRGGQSVGLRATLDSAAPPAGAVITLTSSDPSLATIPSSMTIPGGSTTVTIVVPTRRVSRVLATQVSGTYNGTTLFAVLTVTR